MNKTALRVVFAALAVCLICCDLSAQKPPKWLEKAGNAVVTVEVHDANGAVRRGNGFFIGAGGEAVSDYTLFEGASQAFVTDAAGNRMSVTRILGADKIYDVIRFKVETPKKYDYLEQADVEPDTGAEAIILSFGTNKNATPLKGSILENTKIRNTYGYYKIDANLQATQISLPLVTSDGKVFAMTQADASGKNKTYGISTRYISSIVIGATDLWNNVYSSIAIRKAWSPSPDDARIALIFLASQQDAPTYLETLNDYIATFPNVSDGYSQRASHYAYHRKELAADEAGQSHILNLAKQDMESAIKYAEDEADAYYDFAKLVYGVATADTVAPPAGWDLDVALDYLQKAVKKDDKPLYHQLEGDIALYRDEFEKAYGIYSYINSTPFATAATYYLAAKAKQQIPGANPIEVIALIDSAAQKCLPSEALPYLEESAELKMERGMYEAAARDYDRIYSLMAGNVSDAFYYLREQARFRQGDFDGALNDIGTAVRMQPENAVYHAEMASVYLRRQEPAKAQECAERAITLEPDFASAHRLLGVCYLRLERKDEACQAFSKADELGDPVVKRLIQENCK
ncbi:MAG: tetratricopeptide repeat protein [Tannerella sp.]|nr:tetratricopeptide repeat protein [Tannerella sp.]